MKIYQKHIQENRAEWKALNAEESRLIRLHEMTGLSQDWESHAAWKLAFWARIRPDSGEPQGGDPRKVPIHPRASAQEGRAPYCRECSPQNQERASGEHVSFANQSTIHPLHQDPVASGHETANGKPLDLFLHAAAPLPLRSVAVLPRSLGRLAIQGAEIRRVAWVFPPTGFAALAAMWVLGTVAMGMWAKRKP